MSDDLRWDKALAPWRLAADPELRAAASRLLQIVPEDRVAWVAALLASIGRRMRRMDARWEAPLQPSAALDPIAAECLSAWLRGRPYHGHAYVAQHLAPELRAVFRGVWHVMALPQDARQQALLDLEDALPHLLAAEGAGLPTRVDLSLRVLERAGPGPVAALSPLVPASRWAAAACCLAQRRSWRATLAALWPDRPSARLRARRLAARLRADPTALPALLDLHVLQRLLDRLGRQGWAAEGTDALWSLVTNNQRRVRARLRALLGEDEEALIAPLLRLGALHERTVNAARRLGWDWARRELRWGFAMGQIGQLTRLCAPDDLPAALPEARLPMLQSWVLLVTLRGRLPQLLAWLRDGRDSSRDSVFGRLLKEDLPDGLRDPDGRGARLNALAETLSARLPALMRAIRPDLELLAHARPGRDLRQRIESALRPRWHPSVRFPDRGFPAMQRAAAACLLAQLMFGGDE